MIHNVTVSGRAYTLHATVTPGWRGDHESPPEPPSVTIDLIEDDGRVVDLDEFHAALVAQEGDAWDVWWAKTEDAIVDAWDYAQRAAQSEAWEDGDDE